MTSETPEEVNPGGPDEVDEDLVGQDDGSDSEPDLDEPEGS